MAKYKKWELHNTVARYKETLVSRIINVRTISALSISCHGLIFVAQLFTYISRLHILRWKYYISSRIDYILIMLAIWSLNIYLNFIAVYVAININKKMDCYCIYQQWITESILYWFKDKTFLNLMKIHRWDDFCKYMTD